MTDSVEVRCPSDFRRLFLKLRAAGEVPVYTSEENWLEVACFDCLRSARKSDPTVSRVLHYYSFLGEFQQTRVERPEVGPRPDR